MWYLVGDGAAVGVRSTLVDLLGEGATVGVGVALVDLLALEDAAVGVGSTLVDLLVEDKFHVGELHVDGWWVLKVGDLASVGSK